MQFNKETWEKFHLLKSTVEGKKAQISSYSELIRDVKFVIYLGGAAQMLQVAQRKAIYVGGLGINYKNKVVTFKGAPNPDTELGPSLLKAFPLKSVKSRQELTLKLGRFGHTSFYNPQEHAIYIFGGQ